MKFFNFSISPTVLILSLVWVFTVSVFVGCIADEGAQYNDLYGPCVSNIKYKPSPKHKPTYNKTRKSRKPPQSNVGVLE